MAYDLLFLTGLGMLAATHHGLQRLVIAEISNQTTTLVQPAQHSMAQHNMVGVIVRGGCKGLECWLTIA